MTADFGTVINTGFLDVFCTRSLSLTFTQQRQSASSVPSGRHPGLPEPTWETHSPTASFRSPCALSLEVVPPQPPGQLVIPHEEILSYPLETLCVVLVEHPLNSLNKAIDSAGTLPPNPALQRCKEPQIVHV